MKPVKVAGTSGKIVIKKSITDNISKEVVHEKEEERVVHSTQAKSGEAIMIARWTTAIKLSHKFQSMGIDIGVDMPFPIVPGDMSEVKSNLKKVEAIVEETLAEVVDSLKETVRDITLE